MYFYYLLAAKLLLSIFLAIRIRTLSIVITQFSDFPQDVQAGMIASFILMILCNYLLFTYIFKLSYSHALLVGAGIIADVGLTSSYFLLAVNPANSGSPVSTINWLLVADLAVYAILIATLYHDKIFQEKPVLGLDLLPPEPMYAQ